MQKIPLCALIVSLLTPLQSGASLPGSDYQAASLRPYEDDGRGAVGPYVYMTFQDTILNTVFVKEAQSEGDLIDDRDLEFDDQSGVSVLVPPGSMIEVLRGYEDDEGRNLLQLRINGKILAVVEETSLQDKQVMAIEREVARRGKGGSKVGTITSPIGMRRHPVTGKWKMHRGIDIAMPTGTPVKSRSSGKVIKAGRSQGFGKAVFVQTGGTQFIYGHLSKVSVKVGQQVSNGALLGKSGCTGMCTGPHLHFEKRRGK